MHRVAALSALLLVTPLALAAQASAHPLVGTWTVVMPIGMRVENGEPTPIVGSGSLVVAAVGDSLIGTLTVQPPEGMPPRPATRMAAKAAPGAVTFISSGTAKINVNGSTSERAVTSSYRLEAVGNELKGTIDRRIEGVEEQLGTAAITGKRS